MDHLDSVKTKSLQRGLVESKTPWDSVGFDSRAVYWAKLQVVCSLLFRLHGFRSFNWDLSMFIKNYPTGSPNSISLSGLFVRWPFTVMRRRVCCRLGRSWKWRATSFSAWKNDGSTKCCSKMIADTLCVFVPMSVHWSLVMSCRLMHLKVIHFLKP